MATSIQLTGISYRVDSEVIGRLCVLSLVLLLTKIRTEKLNDLVTEILEKRDAVKYRVHRLSWAEIPIRLYSSALTSIRNASHPVLAGSHNEAGIRLRGRIVMSPNHRLAR